ncbi:citrate synthase [Bosea caraganae]|uniref:citrate synthase (unknown stereospecificity) n=1 Tax=Bosea caraganae TaxID=2763117 RepID=A0A370L650_9HYPH|nr:citrate synthase family protein [Bosea caraganae]RDJ23168.1 citrate synthase [Bosea caraganae]RDJ24719.1 citrate synthase [Bosea caraganae]
MSDWLTAQEVMKRLSLKPQTLYAYVSRGRIEAKGDAGDPRRSLYRAADVARLEYRKTRGRRNAAIAEDAIAWGEPVLASSITTVAQGRLWYRGQDAEILARTARLEDVARLLWACGDARFPTQFNIVGEGTGSQRMFAMIAARAASDPVIGSRAPKALYFEAAAVLDALVDAVAGRPGEGPIHERIARAWGCEAGVDLIRRALVLLADHELNASTFAVRVTASTRASLAACVLAGLSALSGPLHGGMSTRVRAFVSDTRRDGIEAAINARLELGASVPGFGHPLYPEGDPRARALLDAFALPPEYAGIQRATEAMTGELPNIDFALTALAQALHLPQDAPFQIFAAARCTGWIAHAIEQYQSGRLIRPRARYVGELPNPG